MNVCKRWLDSHRLNLIGKTLLIWGWQSNEMVRSSWKLKCLSQLCMDEPTVPTTSKTGYVTWDKYCLVSCFYILTKTCSNGYHSIWQILKNIKNSFHCMTPSYNFLGHVRSSVRVFSECEYGPCFLIQFNSNHFIFPQGANAEAHRVAQNN